jgi:RNA-binding protein
MISPGGKASWLLPVPKRFLSAEVLSTSKSDLGDRMFLPAPFGMLSRCENERTCGIFHRMPAPTSPRKKSLMPSTPLRRRLRSLGHALDPVVQVGKLGASEAVAKQVNQALLDHELIKVKLGSECPETRFELAELLAGVPGVNVVQVLGRTILLYKRHPKKPKIEKEAQDREAPRKAAPRTRGKA